MGKDNPKFWTKEEEKTLIDNYQLLSKKELCNLLNVDMSQLTNRAYKLKIKKERFWDKDRLDAYFHKLHCELGYFPSNEYFDNTVSSKNKPSIKDVLYVYNKYANISKEHNFITQWEFNNKNRKEKELNDCFKEIRRMESILGRLPYNTEYEKMRIKGVNRRALEGYLNMTWNDILITYFNKPFLDITYSQIIDFINTFKLKNKRILLKDVSQNFGVSDSTIIDIIKKPFCDILEECGVTKNKKSNQIKSVDDMKESFKLLYEELGRIPILEEIDENCIASFTNYINKFGSIENLCNELKIEYNPKLCGWGRMSKNKNGEVCRSIGEEIVSNYLIDNNIHYEREIPYSRFLKTDRKYRCDWVVYKNNKPHMVEYFGVESKEAYDKKTKRKVDLINNTESTDGIFIYKEDLCEERFLELFKNCDIKGESEK